MRIWWPFLIGASLESINSVLSAEIWLWCQNLATFNDRYLVPQVLILHGACLDRTITQGWNPLWGRVTGDPDPALWHTRTRDHDLLRFLALMTRRIYKNQILCSKTLLQQCRNPPPPAALCDNSSRASQRSQSLFGCDTTVKISALFATEWLAIWFPNLHRKLFLALSL